MAIDPLPAVQPAATDSSGSATLHRAITRRDLVLMIINSIIGAGIFGLPSRIFDLTGVYSLAAFGVCAAIVLVFILCFAEVGSRFQSTGGPYRYVFTAFGPFPAFLVGWLLLLSRIFNYAALINLLVSYAALFYTSLEAPLPRAVVMISVTAVLAQINFRGVQGTAKVSSALTIAKLLPLTLFIIAGLFFMDTSRFSQPVAPPLSSFSQAVLLLVFAFGGFESVMVNTGEVREPRKNIPAALLLATTVVALFYICIQVACIGNLPNLGSSQKPLADAATSFIGPLGGKLIAGAAVVSILGTLNVLLLSGSRLPFAFSQEGQFPSPFSRVHPQFGTPGYSILLTAVLCALASIAWTFLSALTVAVIIRITVYLFVCASLIQLRRVQPDQQDFFKIRGGYAVAATGILLLLWLLSNAKWLELRNVGLFILGGACFYFLQQNGKRKQGSAA